MLNDELNIFMQYIICIYRLWNLKGVEVRVTSTSLLENNNAVVLLHEGSEMGPVEGVFIVLGPNNAVDEKLVLDAMDHASRKLCLGLK